MAAILQSLFESRVLSLESGGTVIKQINLALLAVAKDRDGGEEKKRNRELLGAIDQNWLVAKTKLVRLPEQEGTLSLWKTSWKMCSLNYDLGAVRLPRLLRPVVWKFVTGPNSNECFSSSFLSP